MAASGYIPAHTGAPLGEHCTNGLAADPDWHAPEETKTLLCAHDALPVADADVCDDFILFRDELQKGKPEET